MVVSNIRRRVAGCLWKLLPVKVSATCIHVKSACERPLVVSRSHFRRRLPMLPESRPGHRKRSMYQRDMRQRLRKIPNHALGRRSRTPPTAVLHRCAARAAARTSPSHRLAPNQPQVRDHPEAACQKLALAARHPSSVSRCCTVAQIHFSSVSSQSPPPSREPRVVAGKNPTSAIRRHDASRVLRTIRLHKTVELPVESLPANLPVNRVRTFFHRSTSRAHSCHFCDRLPHRPARQSQSRGPAPPTPSPSSAQSARAAAHLPNPLVRQSPYVA